MKAYQSCHRQHLVSEEIEASSGATNTVSLSQHSKSIVRGGLESSRTSLTEIFMFIPGNNITDIYNSLNDLYKRNMNNKYTSSEKIICNDRMCHC